MKLQKTIKVKFETFEGLILNGKLAFYTYFADRRQILIIDILVTKNNSLEYRFSDFAGNPYEQVVSTTLISAVIVKRW